MIYIIGGNGYVGSAYTRYCARAGLPHQVITRDNFASFEGTSCDLVVNANGNSRKFLADREPLQEFDLSVRSVAESLTAFKSARYIFLSSGDVYPDPSSPETSREDQALDVGKMSRYGLHKYLAERLVMGAHPNWLVMRMGGFVGPGIKKNAIFDILSGDKVWLAPQSALQFIQTDHAAAIVMGLSEQKISGEIVNLGAHGTVCLSDVHSAAQSTALFDPAANIVRFELSLAKLSGLSAIPVPDTAGEVAEFAKSWPGSAQA